MTPISVKKAERIGINTCTLLLGEKLSIRYKNLIEKTVNANDDGVYVRLVIDTEEMPDEYIYASCFVDRFGHVSEQRRQIPSNFQ